MVEKGLGSGSLERGILLSNAYFVRRFGDSDWNWIRLGVRWRFRTSSSIADDLVDYSFPSRLTFGFCHDTDKPYGGPESYDNIVGYRCGTALDKYTSNAICGSLAASNTMFLYSASAANAITAQASDASSLSDFYSADTASLAGVMVDLRRSSNPLIFTASIWSQRGNNSYVYAQYYDYTSWINDLYVETPTRNGYTRRSRSPIFIDETTYGKINAVNIWWGRIEPYVEIADIWVVRLA